MRGGYFPNTRAGLKKIQNKSKRKSIFFETAADNERMDDPRYSSVVQGESAVKYS
jgi:hypothetical protein